MRLLITGNLGYIGTELTAYLKKKYKKYYIIGYDTGFFKKNLIKSNNYSYSSKVDYQIDKDIRKLNKKDLNGIDAIIHLAALSNDPIGKKYQRLTKIINLDASKKLFNLASQKNVKKFIFASSCSVYGLGGNKAKLENSSLSPLTDYAKSKIYFEKYAKKRNNKIEFTSLRYSTACGVSSRIRLDLVLNDFVASALLNNKIELLSKGDAWRPLIDVHDMCRSIDWALQRSGKKNIIVNVGKNSNNIKIINLAKKVQKYFPKLKLAVNEKAASDKRSYKVDFSFFKKIAPGYQPIKTLDQTILEIKKFLKNKKIKKKFRESNLIRLRKLGDLQTKRQITKNLFWNQNAD